MAISTACPHCGKQFRVKEEFVGRGAKCAACQKTFAIQPLPAGASPTKASPPVSSTPAPRPHSQPAETAAADNDEFAFPSLDALAQAAESEKQAKPLEQSSEAYNVSAPPAPPPLKSQSTRRGTTHPGTAYQRLSTTKQPSPSGSNRLIIVVAVYLALVGISFLAGQFISVRFTGVCILLLLGGGAGVYLWGVLGTYIRPFRESVGYGLACLLFGPYAIYYIITRWEQMKAPFLRIVGGFALILLALALGKPMIEEQSRDNSRVAQSPESSTASQSSGTLRPTNVLTNRLTPPPPTAAAVAARPAPQIIDGSVELYDILLTGSGPGYPMHVNLYLPSGQHAPKSLPCVLIAPAGSGFHGMVVSDSDRPEHLPYVRAGFAVVCYELSGSPADLKKQQHTYGELVPPLKQFMAADGGMVNARHAIDYVVNHVPEVDSGRLFACGHSSAAVMALNLATNSQIRACCAYAPPTDVEAWWNNPTMEQLVPGFKSFATRNSPLRNAREIRCPVYLFHADDDTMVSLADNQRFADTMRATGGQITFDRVPEGGHYESMISEGIARGINFMRMHGAVSSRGTSVAARPVGPRPAVTAGDGAANDGTIRTAQLGGNGGSPFVRVRPGMFPVIGFRFVTAQWAGHNCVRRVDPLYENPAAAPGRDTTDAIAKAGYAVCGLIVNNDPKTKDLWGMQVVFMRLENGSFVQDDQYTSAWIGEVNEQFNKTTIGNTGAIVVGIFGRQGLNADAVGLVMKDLNAGPNQ